MTITFFVPGLQGNAALRYAYNSNSSGTNEATLREVAKELASPFVKAEYQSSQDKNPTLSKMKCLVAAQLAATMREYPNKPIVAIGSSVGFGVLLGALSKLETSASPIALIGFKPVPDPLMAIELQINKPQILSAIKTGQLPSVPMLVESADGIADGIKDAFTLTTKHLNDKRALRILSAEGHAHKLNSAAGNAVVSSTLIYGTKDHLTPSVHMQAFADALHAAPTRMVECDAKHSSDLREMLGITTSLMIAKFD